MPSNLVMCVENAIDQATLTASPAAVSTLPETNLQLAARGRVWRTTSASSQQQLLFTWGGTGKYINFLKLGRHNFEPGTTWRVELFSDYAWTTQIYDSRVAGVDLPAYDYATLGELDWGVAPLGSSIFDSFLGQLYSLVYIPRVLALSGRITITSPGNSAGYLQASRLFAGDYMEFAWNPETASFGWDEDTQQSRSDGGTLRSDGKVSFRTLDVQLTLRDEVQRAKLADMIRYAGLRKDLFISLFPGQGGELERDYTMIAKLAGKLPKLDLGTGNMQQKTKLSFAEV